MRRVTTRRPHGRRTIRLRDHDYAAAGIYLVTVCSHDRAPVFGHSIDDSVHLSAAGLIARDCWKAIPEHFATVSIDEFAVMPDHIHGIVVIRKQVGARHASPLLDGTRPAPQPGSLGAIVGSFKSAVTKAVNELRRTPGATVWQRNYYEQIVTDLEAAREYIRNNRP
jgi:REP element-mobilizing transposase RayT